MGISTKYVLDKIILQSGTVISELNQLDVSPRVQQMVERSSGVPHAQYVAGHQMAPEIGFETNQIASILTECGMGARSLAGGNTDLLFKKVTYGSTREAAASTVHKRIRLTTGMLYWTQIQASQNQTAKATCRIAVGYDGTNIPMIEAGGVALTGTAATQQHFTLGPASINSQAFRGLTEIMVESGIEIYSEAADGEIYPTFLAVKTIDPSITLSGPDLDQISDLDFEGSASGTVLAYLRKKLANQQNVLNGTAQHILFTIGTGQAVLESVRAGGNDGAVSSVKITAISTNEVTLPITVATTSTIS
jgi:hypothetical protein